MPNYWHVYWNYSVSLVGSCMPYGSSAHGCHHVWISVSVCARIYEGHVVEICPARVLIWMRAFLKAACSSSLPPFLRSVVNLPRLTNDHGFVPVRIEIVYAVGGDTDPPMQV